jgi:hypothetical protein
MKIAAILLAASAIAAPALAQDMLRTTAQMVGDVQLKGVRAYTPNRDVKPADTARDPWRPVTSQQMAQEQVGDARKKTYSVSTKVDYNGDGIPDTAYIANNSRQGAVIVQLGGNKGQVVAFRSSSPFGSGQEIVAGGKRRIGLVYPESSVVVLTSEGGKPAVYYPFESEED